MPAFSFTAPHVTPEQEREEEASLSDEMRRKIHNDLYGFEQVQHPNPKEGRPGTADESLVGLYEAIEMLPMQQKKEYMEALKQAPNLVQTESDPIMFLRCENFNYEVRVFIYAYVVHPASTKISPTHTMKHMIYFRSQAAAARLVYYWKIRRKFFGEHRAYLPMTLSGALAEDRSLFETGFLAIHPKDARGRNVLFIDRIRAVPPLASRNASVSAVH